MIRFLSVEVGLGGDWGDWGLGLGLGLGLEI